MWNMCGEREAESFAPPRMYCIDNGTMIGLLGYLELGAGRVTEFDNSAIDQYSNRRPYNKGLSLANRFKRSLLRY